MIKGSPTLGKIKSFLIKKLSKITIKKQVNGVEIKLRNPLNYASLFELGYKISKNSIEKEDIVIDAGACPGEFTIYAAKKVGPKGRVIAFEPHPSKFKVLKENIRLNNLNNVTLINKALWNKEACLDFILTGWSSNLHTNDEYQEGKNIKVESVKLDKELSSLNINKVDTIKMDIEGAEIEALNGMKGTLKNNDVNLIIASYHIRDGEKTCKRVEKILKNQGYQLKTPKPPIGKELITFANKG